MPQTRCIPGLATDSLYAWLCHRRAVFSALVVGHSALPYIWRHRRLTTHATGSAVTFCHHVGCVYHARYRLCRHVEHFVIGVDAPLATLVHPWLFFIGHVTTRLLTHGRVSFLVNCPTVAPHFMSTVAADAPHSWPLAADAPHSWLLAADAPHPWFLAPTATVAPHFRLLASVAPYSRLVRVALCITQSAPVSSHGLRLIRRPHTLSHGWVSGIYHPSALTDAH